MKYIKTIEDWYEAFHHQDKLVRMADPNWIPVIDDRRPQKDQWVQLLENDRLNGHRYVMQHIHAKLRGQEYNPLRVFVAKYHSDDLEGNPRWYLGHVGGSTVWMDENGDCITHWQPLVGAPTIPEPPEEE